MQKPFYEKFIKKPSSTRTQDKRKRAGSISQKRKIFTKKLPDSVLIKKMRSKAKIETLHFMHSAGRYLQS